MTSHPSSQESGDAESYCARFAIFASRFAALPVGSMSPDRVAQELAAKKIAVWSGDSYAVEVVAQLGLTESGGIVRAGVVRYVDSEDVNKFLTAVRGPLGQNVAERAVG